MATLAACSAGAPASPSLAASAPPTVTGTVQFWHFFTAREANAIQAAVNDFMAKYPGIKVSVHGGQDDEKMLKAIAAGQPIDLALSSTTDRAGKFCQSGSFKDLKPFIDRDKLDLTQFPQAVLDYTQFNGVRCTLPMLSDVYGLYYNKAMFQAAGITSPPKTTSELTEDAKKLTVKNPDGTIKVAGFNPLMGWYENAPAHFAPSFGSKWLNPDATSAIGSDPTWKEMATWQKDLVDWYGVDKLTKFSAGTGEEFSPDNAFEKGKAAMAIDGEYRSAFVQAEAPSLQYGTAPFPTGDAHTDLYGGGYVTGNIIGIGKGSQNPEAAWLLMKYLTTDTTAMVKLANAIKNIPTTKAALSSPDLQADDNYKTFLTIFGDPHSSTTPSSPTGSQYQDTMADFFVRWQEGKVSDIDAALKDVDKQINDALSLATAP
jgi:multiple sugar transport system substrate-binding protein